MPANSDITKNGISRSHPANDLSIFHEATLPAVATPALATPVEGTVEAAIAPVERQFYQLGSRTLISGALFGAGAPRKSNRPANAGARLRANDLISELREISGQVNRMMSQVDRAIHRLGEHTGEPLRR